MFFNLKKLSSLNLSNFNTDNVNNMHEMFYNCSSLTSLNLSNFKINKQVNTFFIFKKITKNHKIFSNDHLLNKLIKNIN